MASKRRPLVAGNWKMNGTRASLPVVEAIRDGLSPALVDAIDVLVCPPSTLISSCVAATYGSPVAIGGQNLHARPSGAFTGSISAEMLADLAKVGQYRISRKGYYQQHAQHDPEEARDVIDNYLRSRAEA